MRTDCSTDRYATLYAPWLATADSFASRFVRSGDRVLDLCGGTGCVSRAAIDIGCRSISLLDVNPRVIPPLDGIRVSRGDGNRPDKYFGPHSFDVVVCRQALGYLDLESVATGVAQVLAPGGRFCFNNFRRPKWFAKNYKFEDARYAEAAWYLGQTCWHIQYRVGEGWDLTRFRWHRHDEVVQAMSKHFNVQVSRTGKTNYYTCVVRDV